MASSKYLSSKYLNYIGGFFDGEGHRALEEAQMILMRSLKREVTSDGGKQVKLSRE